MHLKKYYDNFDYEELYLHIKEKFEKKDYYSVILYYPVYNQIKTNINADIMYYYSMVNLNYYDNIKNLFDNKVLDIVEHFLTTDVFETKILFKLLVYCNINIEKLKQFDSNLKKEYYMDNYYNLYYLINRLNIGNFDIKNNIYELLSQMEDDQNFINFVKNHVLNEKTEEATFNFEKYHNYYVKDDLEIICFNIDNIMASCNIIKKNNEVLLVDCGAMIIDDKDYKIDIKEFLSSNNIDISMIKGILITHAHLDHYGSLNFFEESSIPIFMTEITRDLISKSQDEVELSKLNVQIIDENFEYELGNFKFRGIKNGHIIGSVAYLIKNDYYILCSGDILLEEQNTVEGFDFLAIKENIDVLLCESTYGKKTFSLTRKDNEILISTLIKDSIECNLNVFIPAFAIGRTQELIALKNKFNIPGLMIIDGLSKVLTKYYEEKSLCNRLYNLDIIDNKNNVDEINFSVPKIVIASSGMMNKYSTFYKKYFDKVMNTKCVVLKTGYIEYGNYALDMILNSYNVNFYNVSLSAHSSYKDLLKFIKKIHPKILITNHGNGIELE